MLLIAFVGRIVNIIGIYLLSAASEESLNMKGAYFEVLSDMLTSIGVIVAGVIMLTTGWYYADTLISAGIGLLILPRTRFSPTGKSAGRRRASMDARSAR